jgi:ABC-2 type transport system ATP-binding protein
VAAIDVTGLRKVYPDGTVALDGVTLEVGTGEIFGCLGRNGAGKTTTVRILATLAKPTSGTVRVCGLDVTTQPGQVRARVGLSLQQAALDELMTGREHLDLIAGLRRLGRTDRRRRVAELVAALGLGEVADKWVATYTVGMRRRLDTALALVHEPEVLFLDEPTTGLDPQSRRAVWSLVRDYRQQGGTVFLTTQYLDEADGLCDRIAILDRGRLVVVDTPAALKKGLGGKVVRVPDRAPRLLAAVAAVVGEASCQPDGDMLHIDLSGQEDRLPELLAALRDQHVTLGQVVVADPTIEDVFVRLTGEAVDASTLGATAEGVAAIGRTIAATNRRGR